MSFKDGRRYGNTAVSSVDHMERESECGNPPIRRRTDCACTFICDKSTGVQSGERALFLEESSALFALCTGAGEGDLQGFVGSSAIGVQSRREAGSGYCGISFGPSDRLSECASGQLDHTDSGDLYSHSGGRPPGSALSAQGVCGRN